MNSYVKIMEYNDEYRNYVKKEDRAIVLYGAGDEAFYLYPFLERVDYICDRVADGQKKFYEKIIIAPEDLENLNQKLIILVAIKNDQIRYSVHKYLCQLSIDALIFDARNNKSFPYFSYPRMYGVVKTKAIQLKRVRIICADVGWILRKYADKLVDNLRKLGIDADVGLCPDSTADINYFMIYSNFEPLGEWNNSVLWVTHVLSQEKLAHLKYALKYAKLGICMSKDTMDKLVVNGVPREKLCYINPAHDGIIKPKKYVLGITHRNHEDARKRNEALLEIMEGMDPDYFSLKIMGDRWEKIIEQLRLWGFEVEYYSEFDLEKYTELIPSLDYYMFYGWDEAGCGYMDAMQAGIGTIVTPVGYHLDTNVKPTYICSTIQDFRNVLLELTQKRYKIRKSVEEWTWENYTKKHIEVWKYLLGDEDGLYENKHKYLDGIYSMLWEINEGRYKSL